MISLSSLQENAKCNCGAAHTSFDSYQFHSEWCQSPLPSSVNVVMVSEECEDDRSPRIDFLEGTSGAVSRLIKDGGPARLGAAGKNSEALLFCKDLEILLEKRRHHWKQQTGKLYLLDTEPFTILGASGKVWAVWFIPYYDAFD